jgi:hydrogenase maturation protein HypF
MSRERIRITLSGTVQGVGFRPLVHRLASDLGLGGFVRNRGGSLEIEAEGDRPERLSDALREASPPGAVVERLDSKPLAPLGERAFRIAPSVAEPAPAPPRILPDRVCCADCRRDLFDPASRFHRYPFTNCSHCGPRYSIQVAVPYDRAATTMAAFAMCAACRDEYEDPASRRFHAQPIACPDCGPSLSFSHAGETTVLRRADALAAAADVVRSGGILALKALGGYQLVADATNAVAIAELRRRKARPSKPFAIMVRDLDEARRYCTVDKAEAELLGSPAGPIVLLHRRGTGLPEALAPGLGTLGVLLPTTPLHHLLLDALQGPVVCTSGNRAGEPIAIDETEAHHRLVGIADAWLDHDRPIRRALDDSVARVIDGGPQVLRAGRGYAPVTLSSSAVPRVLAGGGHLKNTVAVAAHGRIVVSQHIGDLDDGLCLAAMHRAASDLRAFLDVAPEVAAVDLHPDHAGTTDPPDPRLPRCPVQHHLAHALAVMLEHDLHGPLLAVVWDGSGLGSDGTLWGGEFLRVERRAGIRWSRVGHLRPFQLPGGDAAARDPQRALAGLLWQVPALRGLVAPALVPLLERGINAPVTTSAGRLFDAVAALAGFSDPQRYEGEAALRLEHAAAARPDAPAYPLPVTGGVADWAALLAEAVGDSQRGRTAAWIGARFHAALAGAIVQQSVASGLDTVILTGGCFQNRLLTEHTVAGLRAAGCRPVIPRQLPPNDGAIAAGQALAVAEGVLS